MKQLLIILTTIMLTAVITNKITTNYIMDQFKLMTDSGIININYSHPMVIKAFQQANYYNINPQFKACTLNHAMVGMDMIDAMKICQKLMLFRD